MSRVLDWLIRLTLVGYGVTVFLVCGSCAALLSIEPLIEYSLTPVNYPGSHLIDVDSGGGSGGAWTVKTYRTNDSVDKVITFFEQEMPGFTEIEWRHKPSPVYHNSMKNEGWLDKLAMYEYYGSVTIYPDPDDSSATLLEMSVGYIDH